MTDDEFLTAFEQCSVPEDQWTHEAHVRMTWLYLRQRPRAEAFAAVRNGIQRYNASIQKSAAYHETITRAYLHLICDRMRSDGDEPTFADFQARNPDLFGRDLAALLRHYRKETLLSPAARESFVLPDVSPLPDLPADRSP